MDYTSSNHWSPPLRGFVKLNVNGSWLPSENRMGIVGVIRGSIGYWIYGFS
uniref:RNase H type-1 domain-containing protein n=1 Tax=Cajanus cajan TaxID=3821 RepID=A0A151SRE9_CAJCA|nr:hypothetical protein KK1_003626 [Cajanus cajan]